MTCLLDSQVVLWLLSEPAKLHPQVYETLKNPDTVRFISVVSFWELEIKRGKGKLGYELDFAQILEDFAAEELGLKTQHVRTLRGLPRLHNDPFDRILISQAISEGLTLVTSDELIQQYPVTVLRA